MRECEVFLSAREPNIATLQFQGPGFDDQVAAIYNAQKLVHRIEELEDLVVELKNQNNAEEIFGLKQVLTQQNLQLTAHQEKIKVLSAMRVKFSDLFEKNELFESFQKLMKDRDHLISQLANRQNTMHFEEPSIDKHRAPSREEFISKENVAL